VARRIRQVQQLARSIAASDGTDRGLLERFRDRFTELRPEQRLELFDWLALRLEVEREAVTAAADRVVATERNDAAAWVSNLLNLRRAVASPRRRLISSMINVPGGLQFILELRAEILEVLRAGRAGLESLEEEISHLLNDWCRHGFLYLAEIDRNSSFETIRYLREHELVHPMLSLEEMGARLGRDRLCFALYHVVMPSEPVVFIEVALSRGLVRSIHTIIDVRDGDRDHVESPDTAIFYSINNTQHGLAGLGLGTVLVLRVTELLERRHPSVKRFATLSPMPGFWRRYLRPILLGEEHGFAMTREQVLDLLTNRARQAVLRRHRGTGGAGDEVCAALVDVLSTPDWIEDETLAGSLSRPLRAIAYAYLTDEKDARGKPLDPVANFHLGNGATLSPGNINFGANTSPRGLDESCGLMVNYLYTQTTFQQLGRTVRSLLPWRRRRG
jgi:hypothetical protein